MNILLALLLFFQVIIAPILLIWSGKRNLSLVLSVVHFFLIVVYLSPALLGSMVHTVLLYVLYVISFGFSLYAILLYRTRKKKTPSA
ncbi:hypothetical protein [Alkalicoccus urumqiensis]|uniref:Uncharacterized protein n=1 Tax=Alkalicoccus urumqiensis TaxID=1548213 RepID=A0A2P6MLY2_ALKUR|nr:hypothetical protein [Alkalicoccus urumqiensis]PRO67268.1 hypothetical protein C6I21_01535 [Alkalicoccus urumqiensis]